MRSFTRKRLGCLAAVAVLAAAAGCGSGSSLRLAPVKGTVAYRGKTLDHGQVVFTPRAKAPGPQAVGLIRPDGTFRMTTAGQDGAVPGEHLVTVHCRREVSEEEARNMVIGESLIPEKYSREGESPLRIEVKEGANEFPVVLE